MSAQQPRTEEIEWQFDALDLRPVERVIARWIAPQSGPALGLALEAKSAKHLLDTYVDTVDWRIGRAGYVVRVRREGRRHSATLKNLVASDDGLRRRLELTEPLPSAALPGDPAGPVSSRVRALAGTGVLRPVLEVRTRRRPYRLLEGDEEIGELALDESSITLPGSRSPLRLRRVEIEVTSTGVPGLERLVDALRGECHLQPAALSKFEAGLLGAGLAIPGPPDLGPVHVDANSTLAEIAFAVLRRDVATVIAREPGTRLGEDPEDLHQMRVATRRLRAAIAMFNDVLPARAAHLREEIGWLAGELGIVRDLDVQLIQLAKWRRSTPPEEQAGLAELGATLESERVGARAALLGALDSRRYSRLVTTLTQALSQAPPRRSLRSRTLGVVGLPELLRERHAVARKAARRARKSGRAEDFHRLRIACKKLRYALEFSEECYAGATRRFSRVLAGLQDELGEMQDAEVAAQRLRALALSAAEPLSLEAVFAIGGISERYRRESERLLARLGDKVKVLWGHEWKRLDQLLERRRVAAAPPQSAHRPAPGAAIVELTERAQGQPRERPAGPVPAVRGSAVRAPAVRAPAVRAPRRRRASRVGDAEALLDTPVLAGEPRPGALPEPSK